MMEVLGAIERSAGRADHPRDHRGAGAAAHLGLPHPQHAAAARDGAARRARRLSPRAAPARRSRRGWRRAAATSTSRRSASRILDRLAAELGEGIKLSVLDADGVLVLAVAQGRRDYALTVAPGQRTPIHAGAASKLLLAALPAGGEQDRLAGARRSSPIPRARSPSGKRLRRELARIRRQGWAQDRGENAPEHPRLRRAGAARATAASSRRSACRSSRARSRSGWR